MESEVDTMSLCVNILPHPPGFYYPKRIPKTMLMYGKEAGNRKQETDRRRHTIPNPKNKDQKTSIVSMCITGSMGTEKSENTSCYAT